jgi:FAD/FMN-containing dehydrogenase
MFDEFSATCQDDATTVGLLLTGPDGNPAFAIAVCYCGPVGEGERILRPLRTFAEPLADLITPQPYTQMQTLLDEAWPPGRRYYSKSSVIRRLTATGIETFVALGQAMPTPLSAIAFQQLHGAASRIGVTETAFPHRYDHFSVYVHPATDDPADSEKIIRWGREGWEEIQPFVERAVYVNAIDDTESADQRVRDAYGPNYERLVALKQKYDPLNFFSSNQNIKLAAGAA